MQNFFIEVYLIYKVPGVQQSDSVIHTYINMYIPLHCGLLQGIEDS